MPDDNYFYYIPSQDSQQKYLKCVDENGNNILTSDIIYNDNVQFCIIVEEKDSRTEHFYRPNIYFNADENNIKYTRCADDSFNENLVYYMITPH
jgi:hypothetical protein